MLPISDQEIDKITPLLLPPNCSFDEERKSFIKNLDTIDCQAVPGSGKTTALLAKLLLLEKRLPLEQNRGVLVLSHTNTAIKLLHSKLDNKCNFIFKCPNFIGTIQSFVDQFLAIPFYTQTYQHRPLYIDSEFAKNAIVCLCPPYLNKILDRKPMKKDEILFQTGLLHGKLTHYDKDPFYYKETTSTYQSILNLKNNQYKKGFLFYDDAYLLAQEYIEKYPKILDIIRLRFKYIFVDEMQDMNQTQVELLEKLFNHPTVVYQRIGDINQSIFNKVQSNKIWEFRGAPLILHKTLRLSVRIAPIVERFSLYQDIDHSIVSIRQSNIPPYLFIYTSSTIKKVLSHFVQKIKQHNLQNKKAIFKAIAWVAEKKENCLTLSDYYPTFSKEIKTEHNHIDSISEAIELIRQKSENTNDFNSIFKIITQVCLEILRLENITNSQTNTYYSYLSFWKAVKENPENFLLRKQIYSLCQKAFAKSLITISDFDKILSTLEKIFNFEFSGSTLNFRNNTIGSILSKEPNLPPKNIFSLDGINIEIGTIHSVKGETHTATLVMETKYYTTESQKILNILKGQEIKQPKTREAEAMKMLYVAMSRPTDLLCFACNEEYIRGHEKEIEKAGWKIEKIS